MKVYELSLDAVRRVYLEVLPGLERRDRNLADQLKRAVTSVALNIAEGWHASPGRQRNHFRIALGSCREARCALEIAGATGMVKLGTDPLMDRLDHICAMLFKLSR